MVQFMRVLWAATATLVVLLWARAGLAADISLNLELRSDGDEVTAVVSNRGQSPAPGVELSIELDGKQYRTEPIGVLHPEAEQTRKVKVELPAKSGSYPLIARVSYLNQEERLSLLKATYLTKDQNSLLRDRNLVRIPPITMRQRATVEVTVDRSKGYEFRLLLPEEIEVVERIELESGYRYRLENHRTNFKTDYLIYGVVETPPSEGIHSLRLVTAKLQTTRDLKGKSWFSSEVLALATLLGFILSFVLYRWATREGEDKLTHTQVALVRWSFSIFTVSLFLFLFRSLYVIPDWFVANVRMTDLDFADNRRVTGWLWRVTRAVINRFYFDGGDYDYFIRYVLDPLYLYVLTANYFTLRYIVKPDPAKEKYWHLLKSVFSLFSVLSKKRHIHWSNYTKVAILTLIVKIFYVPMLCSWAINDIFHQQNLIRSFSWDFIVVQRFTVAALILIDVSIFAFGYLVELPQLKNQIRSVEPTVLGWVVCLACYPPFNNFSFLPYEYNIPFIEWTATESAFWNRFALALIAILWAFYCWATVALGPRSSNLTNRGIVDTGPYAYVRHPAYASKTMLWSVSAFFMNDRAFFMCLGLTAVYAMRAWTEERHLSMDPDYLAYKKKVPYRWIPWLI